MKYSRVILVFTLWSLVSGAVGYWFGFREALRFGAAADFVPRGALAVSQLNVIHGGNTDTVTTMLEYDVDYGLIFGHDLFEHPLRRAVGPVWGFDLYPKYEKYVVRMANYRQQHPSRMKPELFDSFPRDTDQNRQFYQEILGNLRDNTAKLNSMVERYASKP